MASRGFKGISGPWLWTPEADLGVTAGAPTVVGLPWGVYPERQGTADGAGWGPALPVGSSKGRETNTPSIRAQAQEAVADGGDEAMVTTAEWTPAGAFSVPPP